MPSELRVSLYADETVANDIYAMTLDAKGRVVVTTQGSVKTLHDGDGDGRADRATVFAETGTGGMGLCFDGNDLLFCGDGWLSRYRDADGDGKADGPPEHLVPMAFGEHGGHAMRKGPDGWWYAIGGNDCRIGRGHATLPRSPIRDPEAGAMIRLSPDGRGSEVIAQGFRNPYDFDFNADGELFTYDSDCERDAFLPWYSPTRIDHVGYAQHHGWRLNGHMRSWARRGDDLDTVDILWPIGRGSPTGVVCYRHEQFPDDFRGAIIALDWTFGKVYFLPLKPRGASYRTEARLLIEPTGTHGFAPTDAVVAPDGSLLISIGGRKTRGAIYRIEYIGRARVTRNEVKRTPLDEVLRAPQPLDAWSRARWEPLALRLGKGPFLAAVVDSRRDASDRVRAVEVVTERFEGLSREAADAGARSDASRVRARVAWSLGRAPCRDFAAILGRLADDPEPSVRLAALDATADRLDEVGGERARAAAAASLGHGDKRVRQASARLAARLAEADWAWLGRSLEGAGPQARVTAALAAVWRHPERTTHDEVIDPALATLKETTDPELRLQAVRLLVIALGDFYLKDPPVEVDTGYSTPVPLRGREASAERIGEAVRALFPAGDRRLDEELGRLLAILEDDHPDLPGKVAAFWTEESDPTRDMHFLIVFSRLRGPLGGSLTTRVARTVLALDRKLGGKQQRTKQTWNDRLAEVVARLIARDPSLADALAKDPEFATPSHVALAMVMPEDARARAAKRFLDAARSDEEFTWSGPLIELLATLPASEVNPVFRSQWSNFGLRESLLLRFAASPEAEDREKFLWGLESGQPLVINAALSALDRLPRDRSTDRLVPPLRLLRRLLLEPKEATLRARSLALIERQIGESFKIEENGTDPPSLRRAYRPLFEAFEQRHPELAKALSQGADEDLAAWASRLKQVDWGGGDAARGAAVFQARACQTCHAGPRALGPDLAGAAGRFSREDLFTAILAPSLDVSPLYRTTLVETKDGQVVSGMVAFESADGLIVQTGATTTVRIADEDIEARRVGDRSLMPTGLLRDLKDGELADLYAYLQTLAPRGRGGEPSPPRNPGSPRSR